MPEEIDLLNELTAFPGLVARAADALEPHRITGYLEGLARIAHAWYHKYRVLAEPEEAARLVLGRAVRQVRSEEHTSELQSQSNLVCRLLLEKKKKQVKNELNELQHNS